MEFRNKNLEWCQGTYNTHTVDIMQKLDRYWYIYVDGKRANRGPFLARRWAIHCVEDAIRRIEGLPLLITEFEEKKSFDHRSRKPRVTKLTLASPNRQGISP